MKIVLLTLLFLTNMSFAAERNQYGGYDPYVELHSTELAELQTSPKYVITQTIIDQILNDFIIEQITYLEQAKIAIEKNQTLPKSPILPALTDEQKSFLHDDMIEA